MADDDKHWDEALNNEDEDDFLEEDADQAMFGEDSFYLENVGNK